MKKENILKLKKMFPNLFYKDKSRSKTVINAADKNFNKIVNFCSEISKNSNTVKLTLIKESNHGLSFYISEYNEKLLDIVYLHEKIF